MLKKPSILVKLGCLMCIILLILFYIFALFNKNFIIFSTIEKIDYIYNWLENKFNIHFSNDKYNDIDIININNAKFIINGIIKYYFYIITIIFYIFFNWYIDVLNGQTNNFYRILAGLLGLFFGIFPGLFILLGKYKDNIDLYISRSWRYR